jgi:hypothetical protein
MENETAEVVMWSSGTGYTVNKPHVQRGGKKYETSMSPADNFCEIMSIIGRGWTYVKTVQRHGNTVTIMRRVVKCQI